MSGLSPSVSNFEQSSYNLFVMLSSLGLRIDSGQPSISEHCSFGCRAALFFLRPIFLRVSLQSIASFPSACNRLAWNQMEDEVRSQTQWEGPVCPGVAAAAGFVNFASSIGTFCCTWST